MGAGAWWRSTNSLDWVNPELSQLAMAVGRILIAACGRFRCSKGWDPIARVPLQRILGRFLLVVVLDLFEVRVDDVVVACSSGA